jgi:bacterioferritin-associated ferredoxin
MYVCLCNALTDFQVKDAVASGADKPRDVYAACKCAAQCGTCTRLILGLIRETVAPSATEATAR